MVKRAESTNCISEEEVDRAFEEVIYRVKCLNLHDDDKLALVGKIEVRRIVELTKIRQAFKQSKDYRRHMKQYGR